MDLIYLRQNSTVTSKQVYHRMQFVVYFQLSAARVKRKYLVFRLLFAENQPLSTTAAKEHQQPF